MKQRILELLEKHYPKNSFAYSILMPHSQAVAQKALEIAGKNLHLNPDFEFIENASLLHDIGIKFTNSPDLGCYGDLPYLAHGYSGRKLLVEEGFEKYALICERHIGLGIPVEEIIEKKLPIPHYGISPVTHEEIMICIADKFFSKSSNKNLMVPKSREEIEKTALKYGKDKLDLLKKWVADYAVSF